MKITKEEIKNIALLSRLSITDEKMDETEKALSDILTYVDQLNELNLEGVTPMPHAVDLPNVLREDVMKPSLDHDLALSNAPEEDNGCFRVPRVVQE